MKGVNDLMTSYLYERLDDYRAKIRELEKENSDLKKQLKDIRYEKSNY